MMYCTPINIMYRAYVSLFSDGARDSVPGCTITHSPSFISIAQNINTPVIDWSVTSSSEINIYCTC